MIIHIPDKDFRMTRYYGFYNNECNDSLDIINELLGRQRKHHTNKIQRKQILENQKSYENNSRIAYWTNNCKTCPKKQECCGKSKQKNKSMAAVSL